MIKFRILYLLLIGVSFLMSCSETYQDYKVDIEQSYSVNVDGKGWNLKSFEVRQLKNISTGDTSKFVRLKMEVFDASAPYPKHLTLSVYLNDILTEMEISSKLTTSGLVYSSELSEIDLTYTNIIYIFQQKNTMPFPPTCTITKYDKNRLLISGSVTGTLYEKGHPEMKRTLQIEFKNYRMNRLE